MGRERFNPKRRVASSVEVDWQERWLARVSYTGNPNHKRAPGDFKLDPPASPRPDKSLCDDVEIDCRDDALELLRKGIRLGWVSEVQRSGWPKNIWSCTPGGHPLEAQLENPQLGSYHGYPLPKHDPFFDVISEKYLEVMLASGGEALS